MKKFIKANAQASSYFLVFVLVQTLVFSGVLIYKTFTDIDFLYLAAESFGPLYAAADNTLEYLQHYDLLLEAYIKMFATITVPTLLTSNVLITLFISWKMWKNNKKNKDQIYLNLIDQSTALKYVLFGIGLNLIISIIIATLPYLLPENLYQSLMTTHSATTNNVLEGQNPLLILLCTGIFAPVAEELVFRYGMLNSLLKINIPFAIIYQALLFGILHGNVIQSVYAFILGLIFGYITYKTGNLFYAIIMHIAINSSSVITSLFNCPTANVELITLLIILLFAFCVGSIYLCITHNRNGTLI